MQPYYHPTSVAIIDDDQNFLESFAFYLSDDFLCRTFKFPEEGLLHLLHQEKLRQEAHSFFIDPGQEAPSLQHTTRNQLIRYDASRIFRVLKSPKRFEQVSVCVIDYDMPGMNGVELCRQISDLPVRKILLTGKTGIDTALRAFNEGLIDCFLMKQEHNLTDRIHAEIARLQRQYFDYVAALIRPVQSLKEMNFLRDPEFQATFEGIIHNRNIDEYYVSTSPPGMILIQKDGHVSFLHVNTDDHIQEHIRIAEKLNAPEQLLSLFKGRQILSIFPTANGYYSPEIEHTWSKHIWPTQKLVGQLSEWYFSLIDDDTLPESLSGEISSYDDYLDTID